MESSTPLLKQDKQDSESASCLSTQKNTWIHLSEFSKKHWKKQQKYSRDRWGSISNKCNNNKQLSFDIYFIISLFIKSDKINL